MFKSSTQGDQPNFIDDSDVVNTYQDIKEKIMEAFHSFEDLLAKLKVLDPVKPGQPNLISQKGFHALVRSLPQGDKYSDHQIRQLFQTYAHAHKGKEQAMQVLDLKEKFYPAFQLRQEKLERSLSFSLGERSETVVESSLASMHIDNQLQGVREE